MTKRKIEYWVIPPDADGEFVANMEEVLETYEKAYDPACPVVCMDGNRSRPGLKVGCLWTSLAWSDSSESGHVA